MRYDIQKRIFLTKKLVELKSVSLVQRAYTRDSESYVNLRTDHVQRQQLSQNYLKNLIQPEQYLIFHQNRGMSETFELMPEIS